MNAQVDLRELAIDRSEPEPSTRGRRRHLLTRYLLPVVLMLGFFALLLWSLRDFINPPKTVTVIPVYSTTDEVRQSGTPLFNAAGWIEPRPTPIRVAALAPGVVKDLLVVEDQPVKRGEPIAELVNEDAKLALDRALADVDLREAEVDEAKSNLKAAKTRLMQPVHLEAALGEAEASLAKIETELKNLPFVQRRAQADRDAAQKDLDSKQMSKGVIPGIEIDIAQSKLDSAIALEEELARREGSLKQEQAALSRRRNALQTQLKLLTEEIKLKEASEAQLKSAEARADQARVNVAEAKLRSERMTIRAPLDGRVYQLVGHPGARVGSGMSQMKGHDGSTVVTLYRPDMLQVRVDVRFGDLKNVQLGQPVKIKNPAISNPLTGKVLFISSKADIQKNTLEVKVEIPDPPKVFKPEMLVDVTFLAPERPDQPSKPTEELKLYVLKEFIHQSEAGPFVWVADQSEGIARRTMIKTGTIGNNGLVEIVSGLTISSRIISSGTENLQDGDRIKIGRK